MELRPSWRLLAPLEPSHRPRPEPALKPIHSILPAAPPGEEQGVGAPLAASTAAAARHGAFSEASAPPAATQRDAAAARVVVSDASAYPSAAQRDLVATRMVVSEASAPVAAAQ
eukprot:9895501-Alexandrium_andersonii.AAC.1